MSLWNWVPGWFWYLVVFISFCFKLFSVSLIKLWGLRFLLIVIFAPQRHISEWKFNISLLRPLKLLSLWSGKEVSLLCGFSCVTVIVCIVKNFYHKMSSCKVFPCMSPHVSLNLYSIKSIYYEVNNWMGFLLHEFSSGGPDLLFEWAFCYTMSN